MQPVITKRLMIIGNFGSKKAGKALEKLLEQPVKMSVVTIDLLPSEFVFQKIYGNDDSRFTVYQHLYGEVSGDVCLAFSREKTLRIADLLLKRQPGNTTDLGPLEESVIIEVANILMGSFLSGLSIATDITFIPSVPRGGLPPKLQTFEKDTASEALFVEVIMFVQTCDIEVDFIFIADVSGMNKILGAIEENGKKEVKLMELMKD